MRLELFVSDLDRAQQFYETVLGFQTDMESDKSYVSLSNGSIVLSLNRNSVLPSEHPAKVSIGERPGRGVEIVLEVDNIHAAFAHVIGCKCAVSSPLQIRPWGMLDFRLLDPDGHYLRVTGGP